MAGKWTGADYWALAFSAFGLGLGLFMLAAAWWKGPTAREQLVLVEEKAPMIVEMPLVSYGGLGARQTRGTYRTQEIRLYGAGRHSGLYRPAKNLWVDDLDRVPSGQKVLFRVDPGTSLIYEATSNGRVLLSYERTAARLNEQFWQILLIGLGLLAFGLGWLAKLTGFFASGSPASAAPP